MSTTKRTTGTWDRDASPLYFLATIASTVPVVVAPPVSAPNVLIALNELFEDRAPLEIALEAGATVFLDSGIFAMTNQHARKYGVSMDEALALPPDEIEGFDRLWNTYGEVVTEYRDRLWGVIELDQGGAENKRRTRARIEDEFGIVPMPVYHPLNDGWDYFDELAGQYDRLCFGNVVQARAPDRIRLITTAYERARQYPELWVHVLGFAPNEWCLSSFPRGSSDSSSWATYTRWPASLTIRGSLSPYDRPGLRYAYRPGTSHAPGQEPATDGYFRSLQFGVSQHVGHGMLWRSWIEELEGAELA